MDETLAMPFTVNELLKKMLQVFSRKSWELAALPTVQTAQRQQGLNLEGS